MSPQLPLTVSSQPLASHQLSALLKQNVDAPNRLIADQNSFARCLVGFPDLKVGT